MICARFRCVERAENPIQRYKRDRGMTFEELAEEWQGLAGRAFSATYLRKLANHQRPSAGLAKEIERWTRGAIKAADLLLGEHLTPNSEEQGSVA